MTDKPRILVVDDEPQLTRVLRTGLKSRGYDVRTAADGLAGFQAFVSWSPDLVITDLAMPNMDGLELCRRLRTISQVPIIILSAKGDEKVKVEALDIGADDYVTKPFGIDELLARVRASLRRMSSPPTNEAAQAVFDSGEFHVDLETRNVTVRGREVHLTPKEFDLLIISSSRRKGPHTPDAAGCCMGWDYVEQDQYLRVFVGNLRKKLGTNASGQSHILTEPWVGYRFAPGE